MRRLICVLALAAMQAPVFASEARIPMFPRVSIETTQGNIVLELDGRRAPYTVSNFVTYARNGFYENTVFHRVIPGFMAQGGGMTTDLKEKPTSQPIPNESGNGLSNRRGTIAMARTSHPHSATAQFFINLADNARLDPNGSRWGYAVFGRVVEGMEVVDAIAEIPTGAAGPFRKDVPQVQVIIKKVVVLDPDAPAATGTE